MLHFWGISGQLVSLSLYPSVTLYMSACLCVCLSVCLFVRLSICQLVSLTSLAAFPRFFSLSQLKVIRVIGIE